MRNAKTLAWLVIGWLLMILGPITAHAAGSTDAGVEIERREGLAPQALQSVDIADAYLADPMGLVAFSPLTRLFTNGSDPWQVWICHTDDPVGVTMSGAVSLLNDRVSAYFGYLSEDRYQPSFAAGTEVGVGDACGFYGGLDNGLEPRLYVIDQDTDPIGGVGGPGTILVDDESVSYEGENRRVEVSGTSVVDTAVWVNDPHLSLPGHEIGHSLFWAHHGAADDYDNALDLMSGGWAGTSGWNLYTSDWIEPEQVQLHHGGTDREYRLGPPGYAGQRMVIITTGQEGHFYSLSVRDPGEPVLDTSEGAITEAGVEVYEIDQRPYEQSGDDGCLALAGTGVPCFGLTARIDPYPAMPAPWPAPYPQYHPAGSSFSVEGVAVTVTAGPDGSLDLVIDGGLTDSGWFLDDDNSVFEADIEFIAGLGITLGCNPPRGDLFCPEDPVTRGQMAAFLVRAFGLPAASTDFFTDDATSVFEADINALAAAEITLGCGPTTFCPDNDVTRGQMAAFLVRAFGYPDTPNDFFTDDETSVFEADINALAAAEVTQGCSETTFCPNQNVTRGQMAAFLHRALAG